MRVSGNVDTFGAEDKRASTWMNPLPLSHMVFRIAAATAFLLTTAQGFSFTSFSHRLMHSTRLQVQPISAEKDEGLTHDPLPLDGVGDAETEWNDLSSFGATLLQLRKEEEEIMLEIGGNVSNDDESEVGKTPIKQEIPFVAREAMAMSVGAATDLDNSVERITVQEFKDDMTVLPMTMSQSSTTSLPETAVSDMPLSRPEHYSDRIDRDKRLLAIGITESVDEPWQWQRFCTEKGGIKPLLKTIQMGANFAQHEQQGAEFLLLMEEYEETFLAACNACRALRDLCSISDDVRAVITDEIIRANAASGNNALMNAFSSLLRHSDEAEVLYNIRPQKFRPTSNPFRLIGQKGRRESRRRYKLYVLQLLLAMAIASDDAIDTFRSTPELKDAVLGVSSYAFTQKTRRWLRYPGELWKYFNKRKNETKSRPFIEAASVRDGLSGQVQGTANQLLAAIGYNQWVPKIPGQKGLRILCFDGGGTRGMSAISSLRGLTEAMGGEEVCDTFDIIAGTSTGAIIAFLVGLRRETVRQANDRYDILVERIFGKTAFKLSTLFTTATYSELPFVEVLYDILGDSIMLDSRADPAVPLVFGVSSVMTSTPTYVTLFRNYNYAGGELPDHFVQDPDESRAKLGLQPEFEKRAPRSDWRTNFNLKSFLTGTKISDEGSRYYGSFRPLQREALRKSTAAPTIFKPVKVKDVLYCDGGIVASNPTAIAIHEARTLFPDVPIELVVSIGTGGFAEEKFSPKFGWDAIVGQIVNSACDGERIHHVLEDIVGEGGKNGKGMKYYRFNPLIGTPDAFPIDTKDPASLAQLYEITSNYLKEPEQMRKLKDIRNILDGKRGWRKLLP